MAEQQQHSEQLRVLIIGAGNKGALGPVSHAAAFTNNPAFKLVGFVDVDKWKHPEASKRWGVECFISLRAAFLEFNGFDVVVVATPDETHPEVLAQLVGMPVRLIFSEKPFTNNSQTARRFLNDFKDHNQTVMVNYTRRFVGGFAQLKNHLQFNGCGKFLGGAAFYGKGLHNLCHWVDTFMMIGIDPKRVNYIDIHRNNLNVFEAFLDFEGGRLDILNFGEEWRFTRSIEREDFPADRILERSHSISHVCLLEAAMPYAVQNIAEHLHKGVALAQNANDAVKVLEICERLLA